MKVRTPDQDVSDGDLLKAVSIRFDRHFPAMNIARALGGGARTVPWSIMEQYTAVEILDEVERRGLDISQLEVAMVSCECCPRFVVDSSLFHRIRGKHSESEVKNG